MATDNNSKLICKEEGCDRPSYKVGWCNMHYQRVRTHGHAGSPLAVQRTLGCMVQGCNGKHEAKGYCSEHYSRLRVYGKIDRVKREKGSGGYNKGGYLVKSRNGNIKYEHREIVEDVIGKKLPKEAIIHHVDGNEENNKNTNLVVCPSQAYHLLIHRRQRAYDACGNANWRKCWICKQYDSPDSLYINNKPSGQSFHRECMKDYKASKEKRDRVVK